jgi:hypothetical protein
MRVNNVINDPVMDQEMRVNNVINDPVRDRMFIGMILTLAINDQGRMLIGQVLNLMTLLNWNRLPKPIKELALRNQTYQ